jgi:hypothetical protein
MLAGRELGEVAIRYFGSLERDIITGGDETGKGTTEFAADCS